MVVRRLMASPRKLDYQNSAWHPSQSCWWTLKITLLDVYLATEETPLFTIDHNANPQCIVGGNIQPTLEDYYRAKYAS